jgi:hypothetical protein
MGRGGNKHGKQSPHTEEGRRKNCRKCFSLTITTNGKTKKEMQWQQEEGTSREPGCAIN